MPYGLPHTAPAPGVRGRRAGLPALEGLVMLRVVSAIGVVVMVPMAWLCAETAGMAYEGLACFVSAMVCMGVFLGTLR